MNEAETRAELIDPKLKENGCGNDAKTSTVCRRTWSTISFTWTKKVLKNTSQLHSRL